MHRDLFKAVDNRARIYQRKKGVAHYALPVTQAIPKAQSGKIEPGKNTTASTDLISMRTLEELTERYAPPSLVINDEDSVVHFQGNLKPFLNFPKGRAEMYLFDLLDDSMRKEILGYRDDEMVSSFQAWESLLHTDDKAQTLVALNAHLKEDTPYEVECRLRHKSGHYPWIMMRGKAVMEQKRGPCWRSSSSLSSLSSAIT